MIQTGITNTDQFAYIPSDKLYIQVVQGPNYQPCRPDRFPEDVEHAVHAGYGNGCGADLQFGGRGITQTGMGHFIEPASRLLVWDSVSLLTVSNALSIIEWPLSIRF
jgi:hypothetical protein